MKTPLKQQRILAGQCPLCGKEAAPYRLCYDHRQRAKVERLLKRGVRHEVIKSEKRVDGTYYSVGPKMDDSEANRLWHRWSERRFRS